ncbi:MAG: RsmE family RNA methyltransferase, partial [Phycisphaerales bacterium JB041]
PGAVLEIAGQEARHAVRVKRLEIGEEIELLDGRGLRANAVVADSRKQAAGRGKSEWVVSVKVESVRTEPPTTPRLHVFACAPKLTRVEDMVDQLSQVGAAAWSPLVTAHTLAPAKAERSDKFERVATEASKQCGRVWTMEIGTPDGLDAVLTRAHRAVRDETRLVLADPSGAPYARTGSDEIALLIGPEAGFTETEVHAAKEAGAELCNIGPHLMRVGTAAVVASGIILNAERAAAQAT